MEQLRLAFKDIVLGLQKWRIWSMLGWQDIQLRYRRSQLGPFWIALNTAIMIYSMGFLYSMLFKVHLAHYLPYLAAGMITWQMISSIVMESGDTFVESSHYIRGVSLPYSTYILRILTRNVIIFLHNLIPILPILIYFELPIFLPQILALIAGFAILIFCGFCFGTVIAIIGTRFRDIKQIINSLVQVLFLVTPIMWQPKMLPEKYQFAAHYNPFNQLIDLIRMPLMGKLPSIFCVDYSLLVALFGFLLVTLTLTKARRHISFWA